MAVQELRLSRHRSSVKDRELCRLKAETLQLSEELKEVILIYGLFLLRILISVDFDSHDLCDVVLNTISHSSTA